MVRGSTLEVKYFLDDILGYFGFTHDFRNKYTLSSIDAISLGMSEIYIANLTSRIDLLSIYQFVNEVNVCVIILSNQKQIR